MPATYATVTSRPAGTDHRAGAVACALITVVLASTAIQLPSPGSTPGATRFGMSRQAAAVTATSPATRAGVMPWRSARAAYQIDQPVSAATPGSSRAGSTGGVRTDSATTAPTSPHVNRSSAGNVVKMRPNAPPAGLSSAGGGTVGAAIAGIGRCPSDNDPVRVRAAEIDIGE